MLVYNLKIDRWTSWLYLFGWSGQ